MNMHILQHNFKRMVTDFQDIICLQMLELQNVAMSWDLIFIRSWQMCIVDFWIIC